MTRKFFSGNNLEQVVMMAARHYEIEPEELAYRQIEKRHGFLRTRKAVMIAVDPENPRRQPQEAATAEAREAAPEPPQHRAAAPREMEPETAAVPEPEGMDDSWDRPTDERLEPVGESAPEPAADSWASPAATGTIAEKMPEPEGDSPEAPVEERVADGPAVDESASPMAAAEIPRAAAREGEHDDELLDAAEKAAGILMAFAGIDAEATARSGDERVEVEIEGPDATLLVVEGGKGLLAIQHLLPRMLRGLTGRSSFVRADSDGFHRKRKERLQTLAAKEAEASIRTGRPRTLPPMAPDERRIVHLALQDAPSVETESRGTGLHKRVVIRPVAGDGGSDDIEARHGF